MTWRRWLGSEALITTQVQACAQGIYFKIKDAHLSLQYKDSVTVWLGNLGPEATIDEETPVG